MNLCSNSDVLVIPTLVQSSQEVSAVDKESTPNQKVYHESLCTLFFPNLKSAYRITVYLEQSQFYQST